MIAFTLLFGICSEGAIAAGENAALKGTAVSKFKGPDLALMKAKVDQALKAETDGETLEWRNAETGAAGTVTPLARFSASGLACRRLRIVSTYRETNGAGVYRFCEKPAGQWKLVGPD